jgi:hypothetical protein
VPPALMRSVRAYLAMTPARALWLSLIVVACSPVRGCVESNFTLAPDSRLPQWYSLSATAKRSDVALELYYWTSGTAVFEPSGNWGAPARKLIGQSCWHPRTRYTKNADGTYTAPGGPEYVIVKIDGTVDVVEHNHVPGVFRMTDDQSIILEARQSIARGECRHEP